VTTLRNLFPKLIGKGRSGEPNFSGRRQSDGFCLFVQINFPSSRKSIKYFFWELQNQYFILTSFIESKNVSRTSKNTFYLKYFIILLSLKIMLGTSKGAAAGICRLDPNLL
jgi:hypothetical protein